MLNEYQLGSLHIAVSPDWKDITGTLDDENASFTLAKDTGVGAFQFSTGEYRGGEHPQITLANLHDLRASFASGRGFPEAFDEISLNVGEAKMMVSAGSYHAGANLVRVWYASDGANVLFATYLCDWNLRNDESKECDAFVRHFGFQR